MAPHAREELRLLTKDLKPTPLSGEMARTANLSSSRLRQFFKAETGLALTRYLRALLMSHVKELVGNTFLIFAKRDLGHFDGSDHAYVLCTADELMQVELRPVPDRPLFNFRYS